MKLADFPGVGALPVQEKLELVDELWLSVTPQLESLATSEEEKSLLDSRWAAFLKTRRLPSRWNNFRRRCGRTVDEQADPSS